MPKAGMALTLSALLFAGNAHADSTALPDWYRQARAAVQSLLGQERRPDTEVIAPPANIDPKMAVIPPGSATMRIIAPSSPARP
jgi:hypothetical protein